MVSGVCVLWLSSGRAERPRSEIVGEGVVGVNKWWLSEVCVTHRWGCTEKDVVVDRWMKRWNRFFIHPYVHQLPLSSSEEDPRLNCRRFLKGREALSGWSSDETETTQEEFAFIFLLLLVWTAELRCKDFVESNLHLDRFFHLCVKILWRAKSTR